ncbi:zinc knuckle CX2CX4HX4C containing protein [Tanacetum coccineum]
MRYEEEKGGGQESRRVVRGGDIGGRSEVEKKEEERELMAARERRERESKWTRRNWRNGEEKEKNSRETRWKEERGEREDGRERENEKEGKLIEKLMVSQFLEGKLVLMGDDWKPASDTPSNNGENGLVNVIKSDSLNSIIPIFYANWLNGEQSKRVAYPVVEKYVKNVWSRFCHVRTMMNSKGIFFFKFSSNSEMESMIENGPWLIHNVPLILRKWYRLVNVAKEDLQSVPVWLKLHDVPIMAFTEDGLSVISTKLGTPLMLDTYTTSMCMESWVWSSSAREIIDIHADVKLKDTLVMSVPKIECMLTPERGESLKI